MTSRVISGRNLRFLVQPFVVLLLPAADVVVVKG